MFNLTILIYLYSITLQKFEVAYKKCMYEIAEFSKYTNSHNGEHIY